MLPPEHAEDVQEKERKESQAQITVAQLCPPGPCGLAPDFCWVRRVKPCEFRQRFLFLPARQGPNCKAMPYLL